MKTILSYGSLINPNEINSIAPEASYIPVKINNFRRHFGQKSMFRKGENGERGVLTVEKDNSSWCNGVLLYNLEKDYITQYEERESGYNIKNVDINTITSYSGYNIPDNINKCYIAVGKRPLKNPEPIPKYVELCLNGAKHFGNKYLTDFLITTDYI